MAPHITIEPLKNAKQTASKIAFLIRKYSPDLSYISLKTPDGRKKLNDMTLSGFFNVVKDIPYKIDEKPVELVGRPYRLLTERLGGLDCKKKTVLMAAYCKENGIPFQLVGSSNRPDKRIHHIFPRALIRKKWRVIDATYPHNKLFGNRTHTKEIIFYDSTK